MKGLPIVLLALMSAGESADPLTFVVRLEDHAPNIDEDGISVRNYGSWFNDGAWSKDGRRLAAGSNSPRNESVSWDGFGSVQIFDSSDWSSPPKMLLGSNGQMMGVSWSPDDMYLAAGSGDGYVRIYDTTTWQMVHQLGRLAWIRKVKWSSTGRLAVFAKADGGLHECCYPVTRSSKECEAPGQRELNCPIEHNKKDLHIYDNPIHDTQPSRTIHFESGYEFALAWSPDGSKLAVGADARDFTKEWDEPGYYTPATALKVFDSTTWQLIKDINVGPNAQEVVNCGWSSDGAKLIVAAQLSYKNFPEHDGALQIYSSADWTRIQETIMEEDADEGMGVSKDGLKVAIGDDDDMLSYFTSEPSGNNFTMVSTIQEGDDIPALDWTVIDGYDVLAAVMEDYISIYKSGIITTTTTTPPAPTTTFEPCRQQQRFDVIMCKSYQCTACSLQWCTETCQEFQNKFPGCRCKEWPETRSSYSDGDFAGRSTYGNVGDYSKK